MGKYGGNFNAPPSPVQKHHDRAGERLTDDPKRPDLAGRRTLDAAHMSRQRRDLGGAGAALALALLLLTASPRETRASKFPNRRAVNACSLVGVTTDDLMDRNCQVESVHGEASTNDGTLLRMKFGEANCTVVLKNCVPGVCYSIIDRTYDLHWDPVPRKQPSSFFSSISVAGGKDVSHTPRGVAFRSEERTVSLTYSTHTCSDFYWYRGRERTQLCNAPYPAIMTIEAGAPFALPCAG